MDLSDYLADQRQELRRFFDEPNGKNLERTVNTALTHVFGAGGIVATMGSLIALAVTQSNEFLFYAGMGAIVAHAAYDESRKDYRYRHGYDEKEY